MPWCEACTRFYNPNTVHADGTCPNCGAKLAEPAERQGAPWHFWLLTGALAIYLGWRLIQLILLIVK